MQGRFTLDWAVVSVETIPDWKDHWCLPGGQGAEGANRHSIRGSFPADILKGHGKRAVLIQHVIRHHHGESGRYTKVRYKTDKQGGDDADGNGSLGVLHLLTCNI